MVHDVIIVGGSYAGLSAGLQLARARRKVLMIDAGQRVQPALRRSGMRLRHAAKRQPQQ